MRIAGCSLYEGLWPDEWRDCTTFISVEEMRANPEKAGDFDVLVPMPMLLTAEFIEKLDHIKWIQLPSTGYDMVDTAKIKEKGIIMTNGNGCMSASIAEDVFCKMLVHSRRVREFEEAKKNSCWNEFGQNPWMAIVSRDLYLKKLGLIGDGTIAREIAKRAKAFEIDVTAYGITDTKFPFFDRFINTKADLDTMLSECDYIVVAIPLCDETYHMIGKREFELMKKTALIVNIARGKIINEEEMVEALANKEIEAAALDVFEVEPLPKESRLWALDNVYITTHKSGTGDSWIRRLSTLLNENFKRYQKGEQLLNYIDL